MLLFSDFGKCESARSKRRMKKKKEGRVPFVILFLGKALDLKGLPPLFPGNWDAADIIKTKQEEEDSWRKWPKMEREFSSFLANRAISPSVDKRSVSLFLGQYNQQHTTGRTKFDKFGTAKKCNKKPSSFPGKSNDLPSQGKQKKFHGPSKKTEIRCRILFQPASSSHS